MPVAKLRDPQGADKGEVDLPSALFESKIHRHAMWQSVRNYLANQRHGTVQTKNRAAVTGGGTKPWRQKGTGRARSGTIRSNIWVGGGRAFGPTPRDHYYEIPKKVKRLALRSALTVTAKEERVTVLTGSGIEEGKTREAAGLLQSLGLAGTKCLLITEAKDPIVVRAGRNIPHLLTTSAAQVNTYDILWADHVLITSAALEALQEVRVR
jgi:large subunit ribosomal protein L4